MSTLPYSKDIIFANPIKTPGDICLARENHISIMTFDNEAELHKIASLYPEAELLLRLKVNDVGSSCRFGDKFGCTFEEAISLIHLSKDLPMNIIGFSFHVGSGCTNPKLYSEAIQLCRDISIETSLEVRMIDIGGGFTSRNLDLLQEISTCVNESFQEWSVPKVIAEPGRFFAETPFTLKVSVIGKNRDRIYIDDGVYGSFNNIIFDHAIPRPLISLDTPTYMYTVYGRTCDSIDTLGILELPYCNVGDIITFLNMGAYTLAAASQFNGFIPAKIYPK